MINCADNKRSTIKESMYMKGVVTCRTKGDAEDEGYLNMENNLGIPAKVGTEESNVGANPDILEEQDKLTKTAEESLNGNTGESDEESTFFRKRRERRIIDSDEDENFKYTNKSNKENIEKLQNKKEMTSKSRASKKKSKSQIKEERLKIHSETHRLMREREVSIPYHLPRHRTLREFLSRKKNRANIPLNSPSFKMLEIWKDIEESTKSAFEFFKSESDSDPEDTVTKNKQHEQVGKGDKDESLSCNDKSNGTSTHKTGNDDDNRPCVKRQNNFEGAYNTKNSVPVCEPVIVESNNIEKINKDNTCAVDVHKEDGEVLSCEIVGNESNKASNSAKNFDNSLQCIHADDESLQSVNEANSDESYLREKTLEWVKNIPACEKLLKPSKKEMLLKKLNPKLLNITPKLSGESDSVIDLENVTDDIEIGAQNLKKRFFENCFPSRQKTKTEVELTITVSENNDKGEIKNVTTEKLIYNSAESFVDVGYGRPGSKLQRLKEELKKKIEEKWEEEYKRKINEMQLEARDKAKQLATDNVVEEEDEEELLEDIEDSDETDISQDESEEDDENDIADKPERKIKKNAFIDSGAEESECEDEESGNEGGDELDEDENEDKDDCGETTVDKSPVHNDNILEQPEEVYHKGSSSANEYDTESSQIPPYQPGGGMLNGGSELSQCDDDSSFPKNIFSPTLKLSLDFSPVKKKIASQESWDLDLELSEITSNKVSFVPRFPENENFDLSDAYEFCSGKFPDNVEQSLREVIDSQDSVRSEGNESRLNSSVIANRKTPVLPYNDCSEKGEVDAKRKQVPPRREITNDSSEDEGEPQNTALNDFECITGKRMSSEESDNETKKSFILKSKKTRKHLQFSDEEGISGSDHEKDEHDSEDEPQEKSDFEGSEVEAFVKDSVEEVQYNSEEEEVVNPREFFEKEAELSGSEWSGDEDERGLDKMEEEDGDGDKLDDNQIRSQLEKIHMRTLLDDDARQVRLLQELLFEDGDLFDDGPKREKNFRWKDLGTFFEDDGNGDNAEKFQDHEEIEEDEQSTKTRHEKELFLLNLKNKKDELGVDEDDDVERISSLKVGKILLQRSVKTSVPAEENTVRQNSSDIDNMGLKAPVALTKKRGSFLSRNEEFLSRLAKFTSNATDNILGPKHSKNFVFATKSPEKTSPLSNENSHPKRKGLSPESENQTIKKAKLQKELTHSKISILDRLS